MKLAETKKTFELQNPSKSQVSPQFFLYLDLSSSNVLIKGDKWNITRLSNIKRRVSESVEFKNNWNMSPPKNNAQVIQNVLIHGFSKTDINLQKCISLCEIVINVSIWATAHLTLPLPNINPNLSSADYCLIRGWVGAVSQILSQALILRLQSLAVKMQSFYCQSSSYMWPTLGNN